MAAADGGGALFVKPLPLGNELDVFDHSPFHVLATSKSESLSQHSFMLTNNGMLKSPYGIQHRTVCLTTAKTYSSISEATHRQPDRTLDGDLPLLAAGILLRTVYLTMSFGPDVFPLYGHTL